MGTGTGTGIEFLMTCGHMSSDAEKCPHGCPDSKRLNEPERAEEETPSD